MKIKFSLEKKIAIITGGGSGIGQSIARTFAEQGAQVHILDFNIDAANETAEEIIKQGFLAKAHKCDVSDYEKVSKIVNQISDISSIDILINNAGIANIGNIEACSEKDLDRLYKINIKGVYNCSKVCIPLMKNKSGGVILNMASIASTVGISDRFAYSMTKGAVLTMTYSIAKDYIDVGVFNNLGI